MGEFIKNCKICGDEFITPVWNKIVCDKAHYHPCPICGKPILSNKVNRQNCACSVKCGQQMGNESRKISLQRKYGVSNVSELSEVRDKISRSNIKPYWEIRHHYRKCRVCGKEFDARHPYNQMTCSSACRGKYRKYSGIGKQVAIKAKGTLLKKYGVRNPRYMQNIRKTCIYCGKEFVTTEPRKMYCDGRHESVCVICGKPIEWHGRQISDGVTCSDKCKIELRRKSNLLKYGCINAINSVQAMQKSKQTCLRKYGVEHFSKTEEYQTKKSKTNLSRYGVKHALQNRDIHIKMANTRKMNVTSDGKSFDSSYESKLYQYCLDKSIRVSYQLPLKYIYNDRTHTTFIDFLIENRFIECKGGYLLDGVFDYMGVPVDIKLSVYEKHNVILITDDYGERVLRDKNKYDITKIYNIKDLDRLFMDIGCKVGEAV